MIPPPDEPGSDCAALDRSLIPYLAGAQGEEERAAFERHLSACPRCAPRIAAERSFDRDLRERLRGPAAPEDLVARVRATLAREAPTPREAPWQWARSSGLAAVAASVILALLVFPFLDGSSSVVGPPAGPVRMVQRAVVVDSVCDRAGLALEHQRACRHAEHLNVLKSADGRYWTVLLRDGRQRDLVLDPELRGRRLVVVGDFYPAIMSVRVERWSDHEDVRGVGVRIRLPVEGTAEGGRASRGWDLATLETSARASAASRTRRGAGWTSACVRRTTTASRRSS